MATTIKTPFGTREKLPWEKDEEEEKDLGVTKLPTQEEKKEVTPTETPAAEVTKPTAQEKEKEIIAETSRVITYPDNKGGIAAIRLPDGRIFSGLDEDTLMKLAEPFGTPEEMMGIEDIREGIKKEEEIAQRQEKGLEAAEAAGVFEARPEERELGLTEEEEEKYGPLGVEGYFRRDIIFGRDREEGEAEIQAIIQNPESRRAKMMQEIQREVLNKASTGSQRLGAALEPIVGDLEFLSIDIGAYADNLLRMPTQEVEEIVKQIKQVENDASGMTDSVAQGEIGNPYEALRELDDMDRDLARSEARIKRLILDSEELKANPEKVIIIQGVILAARKAIFEAKQRAAEGAITTPTDSQLYFKLKELREK